MWPSRGGCAKTRPASHVWQEAFQPGQTRLAQARPANRCLHCLRRGDGQDLYCERLKLSDFSTPKNIGQTKPYKIYKTFLATYAPVGGVIRVVLVKEDHGWYAFFCTDPNAGVKEILETSADRVTIEQDFLDVKEVWGPGQQQVRNIWMITFFAHCTRIPEIATWTRFLLKLITTVAGMGAVGGIAALFLRGKEPVKVVNED